MRHGWDRRLGAKGVWGTKYDSARRPMELRTSGRHAKGMLLIFQVALHVDASILGAASPKQVRPCNCCLAAVHAVDLGTQLNSNTTPGSLIYACRGVLKVQVNLCTAVSPNHPTKLHPPTHSNKTSQALHFSIWCSSPHPAFVTPIRPINLYSWLDLLGGSSKPSQTWLDTLQYGSVNRCRIRGSTARFMTNH